MTISADFPIVPFSIALFIGALIGLEREKKKTDEKRTGVGGIRTFTLFSMAGAIAAWLTMQTGISWVFVTAAICVTAVIIAGSTAFALQHPEAHGLRTEIAALVTFLLGATAVFGFPELSVALAITTSALLAFKRPLHELVGRVNQDDLYAALKLLIASFIVLPVLPNETIDPLGALNPYKMWVLVIIISALSLIGYATSRWLGERKAISLTGFFGGFVSSTAVSLEFAKRSKESTPAPGWSDALAGGLLLSWFVMFARVIVIVGLTNTNLLPHLVPAVSAMGLASVALGLFFYRRAIRDTAGGHPTSSNVPMKNPFSIISASKFAAFFAVVLVLVKLIERYGQGAGITYVAALAGLTDVDAITLSMADYGSVPGQMRIAIIAILVAIVANTAVKIGLVGVLGSKALLVRIATASILIFAVGALSLYLG